MNPPKLSILTPACWERIDQARALHEKIMGQVFSNHIEHLTLFDNRARSIGMKRQALVDSARGEFIAFVDDDDDVTTDYVPLLVEAIAKHPDADVITFDQDAIYNGKEFVVHFQIGAGDDRLDLAGPDHQRLTRGPWHVCAWRRSKVKHCQFLDTNYGEDAAWVSQARQAVQRAHHIDATLHTYRHDARTTLAPEPLTQTL